MIVLLLLGAAVCANAASIDSCSAGVWSDWGECVSSRHCPQVPLPVYSYPMVPTAEPDEGNVRMEYLMKKKADTWKAQDECRLAGTCPELLFRPIGGDYVCDETGMAGDIPCNNIDQLAFLTFEQMGYIDLAEPETFPRGNDIWGWTDPENGDEYAIAGFSGGTAFVRITDPVNPVPVGFMYTTSFASNWRDIKVIGNYAYVGSEANDHGLQVFDLTRLRGRNSIEYFQPDAMNMNFGRSHNIVANEETNFIYVVGGRQTGYPDTCGGGLLVIDVSDPLNPTFVTCFGGDGYVHDAHCVVYHGPDTRYTGHEICFCFNENSFTIVDVTDKQNIHVIAKTGYVNVAYTHQGWVTEDHKVCLMDDEQDELGANPYTKSYVWDIENLQDPQLKTVYQSSETSIDHNQYIIGDYTFQSNYESGLRILHLNRATYELSQVAYFDVYPDRTTAAFNGAWSVFPYYQSQVVVICSINHGMFIVRPKWDSINRLVESGATMAQQTRTREGAMSGEAYCPLRTESKTCAAPKLC
jgi:choice-of-anchor B domain-containing protein